MTDMDPERYTEAERKLTTADFCEPFIEVDLSKWAPQDDDEDEN